MEIDIKIIYCYAKQVNSFTLILVLLWDVIRNHSHSQCVYQVTCWIGSTKFDSGSFICIVLRPSSFSESKLSIIAIFSSYWIEYDWRYIFSLTSSRYANVFANLFNLMLDANIPDITLERDETVKKVRFYQMFSRQITRLFSCSSYWTNFNLIWTTKKPLNILKIWWTRVFELSYHSSMILFTSLPYKSHRFINVYEKKMSNKSFINCHFRQREKYIQRENVMWITSRSNKIFPIVPWISKFDNDLWPNHRWDTYSWLKNSNFFHCSISDELFNRCNRFVLRLPKCSILCLTYRQNVLNRLKKSVKLLLIISLITLICHIGWSIMNSFYEVIDRQCRVFDFVFNRSFAYTLKPSIFGRIFLEPCFLLL